MPPDRVQFSWQFADCSALIQGNMRVRQAALSGRQLPPPRACLPLLRCSATKHCHRRLPCLQLIPKDDDGWWHSIYIVNFKHPLAAVHVNGQPMARTEWQYFTWSGALPTGLRVSAAAAAAVARECWWPGLAQCQLAAACMLCTAHLRCRAVGVCASAWWKGPACQRLHLSLSRPAAGHFL